MRTELERFDACGRAKLDELLDDVEAFLRAHGEPIDQLEAAVSAWRGSPIERSVENRALALVDALRHLRRAVLAGVEADRDTSEDFREVLTP